MAIFMLLPCQFGTILTPFFSFYQYNPIPLYPPSPEGEGGGNLKEGLKPLLTPRCLLWRYFDGSFNFLGSPHWKHSELVFEKKQLITDLERLLITSPRTCPEGML